MEQYSIITKDNEFSNIAIKGTVIKIEPLSRLVFISSQFMDIVVQHNGKIPEIGKCYYFMIIQFPDKRVSIINDFILI